MRSTHKAGTGRWHAPSLAFILLLDLLPGGASNILPLDDTINGRSTNARRRRCQASHIGGCQSQIISAMERPGGSWKFSRWSTNQKLLGEGAASTFYSSRGSDHCRVASGHDRRAPHCTTTGRNVS